MDREDDDAADDESPPEDRPNRSTKFLTVALLLALTGLGAYAWKSHSQAKQLKSLTVKAKSLQVRAPGSVRTYRLKPSDAMPSSPTLALGWPDPPELLELIIDKSDSRLNSYQVTVDKRGEARIFQVRRIVRDSNGTLRLSLNSSAFGRGEYEVKIEGYNWRGELSNEGWLWLSLD